MRHPTEQMLEDYHYDLIEHAKMARLIKEANGNKPDWRSQFLYKAGDGLIALGSRLRRMSRLPEDTNSLHFYKARQVR